MDFVRSYFFTNATSTSWTFLGQFLSSLLGGCNSKATPNPPKSDDKNGQEMFNVVFKWSEVHSEKKYYL